MVHIKRDNQEDGQVVPIVLHETLTPLEQSEFNELALSQLADGTIDMETYLSIMGLENEAQDGSLWG